jgi:hypothetical protein
MLTMLFPTRMVMSSRCGSDLRARTVSAPGMPSSTRLSIRCCGSENIAISDEEKNADNPTNTRMATTPRRATVVCPGAASAGVKSVLGGKPMLAHILSGCS